MQKILIVDDDLAIRTLVNAALTSEGYEVLDSSDGASAVLMASKHLPDLVISDISMPELDGYGVLSALRNDSKTLEIPVIFLTANNDHEAMRQSMEMGADDYLTKPFSPSDLLGTVRTQLKKRAAIAQKHETSLRVLRKNIVYALPHELRTPLHVIMGNAQLMSMSYQNIKPDEIRESADAIVTYGKQLNRIIENFLVYAQIELIAGDDNEIESLRNHLVRDAATIIEKQAIARAKAHKREADLKLDLQPLAMRISDDNLKKIAEELVDNAFKFSEPGTCVKVSSGREGDCYIIRVSDQGRGMSADEIANMGAYMQFNRAMFEQQGMGLGFTIAQRLIQLHKGTIKIESQPKLSTQITVSLPAT